MSYTKRADGRYQTRIYIGKVDGKKRFKYLYANSERELKQLETLYRQKSYIGIDLLTFDDSFQLWYERLKPVKEKELTESQYDTWCARINYFLPHLQLPLKEITQVHIQPIINELFKENPFTKKATARRTLERYLGCCSDVFEYAIENRATEFNPCKYVKIPKDAETYERQALSEEEQRWVREFKHRAQLPAMLMMYSGLRRGEASALTWNDIDFKNNTITVDKSYDFKNCKIKRPKTEAGKRIVTVPQLLIDYLLTVERKSIYVVTTAEGKIMTETAWKRLFESYMCDLDNAYGKHVEKRANKFDPKTHIYSINTFTPHCLRHTFCTLMYLAGVDVLTCRQQMGHADIKTTLSIYTHLDQLYKKKNINKLDAFLEEVCQQVCQ